MRKRLRERALEVKGSLALEQRTLLVLLVILFLMQCSCSSLAPAPAEFPKNPNSFYRRDLSVTVDGLTYPGYGVLPVKDSYQFEAKTKHDMDRFSYTNCHKQVVEEKVDGVSMFSKSAKYKFTFKRQTPVEQTDPCPLQLVASADGNEHSWAFFDFQDSTYQLKAHLECDGWQADYHGVSVCQSRAGLTQLLRFDSEVMQADELDAFKSSDQKTFIFQMPRGMQVRVFCSKDRKCHRITLIGYDEAWLRERKQ